MEVGARVETANCGKGRIAFRGSTQFADGEWIGVVLDEPKGKNNGTVKDVEYFKCEPNYGLFVRPDMLTLEGSKKASGLRAPNTARKESVPMSRVSSAKPSPGSSPGMSPAASTERLTKSQTSSIRKPGSTSRLAESVPNEPRMVRESSNLSQASTASARGSMPPPRPSMVPEPKKKTSIAARPAPVPATPANRARPTPPVEAVVAEPADDVLPPPEPEPTPEREIPTASVLSRAKKIDEAGPITPMSPISTAAPKSADIASELEYLRQQVKELNEKLETLRNKRKEDHAKLLEYDRQKIDMIAMQEATRRLNDTNVELQRKLLEAQKVADELRDWKNSNQDIMNEHQEMIEMAAIDKEMAEEKAEALQADCDRLKERVEELEADLEILREEMNLGGGEGAPAGNSVQMRQVEQQNERLKEALIKLRDLNGQATLDKQEAVKEAERLRNENAELVRLAENLRRQTEVAESRIDAFQEQINAAMGAEEMVTLLTSKNMDMEDRIQTLEQQIEDMEELHDMDEQLAEAQKQTEKDLLHDIEALQIKISELNQQIRQERQHSEELSNTILKFRKRTGALNEEIQDYKDQMLRLEEELHGHRSEENQMASMVSTLQVNATRAFAEAVERQTNAIELEFSKRHAGYLKAFLPDNFAKAGGDNDSVAMCVLFPRMAAKCRLLAKLAAERFPHVPGGMRREHVTKSHKGEQWAHVNRVAYLTSALVAVLGQFESAVNETSLERLARLTQMQPDMSNHERVIDQYFELLRQGRFDDNSSLDNLEKALLYFQNVFSLHIGGDGFNAANWVTGLCSQLSAGLAYCRINIQRLGYFLESSVDSGEEFELLKTLNDEMSACESVVLKASKCIPNDASKAIKLNSEFTDELLNAVSQLDRVLTILREACSIASVQIGMNTEGDGFAASRIREMIHVNVEKTNGPIALDKAFEPIRKYMWSLRSSLEKTVSSLDGGKMETDVPEKKNFPPLLDRAHQRKQAASEAEGLRWQMEKKDNEILEMRKQLKARIEDISNFKLRLDMSEARMDSAGKQDNAKAEHLQTKMDQLVADHRKRQIEYEETMDTLQREMQDLMNENAELKQRANQISKQALWKGIQSMEARTTNSPITATPMTGSASPAGVAFANMVGGATRGEVVFLETRLQDMRARLKRADVEIMRLKTELAQSGFKRFGDVPGLISGPLSLEHQDSRLKLLNELHKEALALKRDEVKYWMYVPDAKLPVNRQRESREKWEREREIYDDKIYTLYKRLRQGWNDLYPGEEYPLSSATSCKTGCHQG
ncbi:unnamed protein product [Caenorhabditis auriculariae]|uniref:Dynactin subunit 1 n=1 Tax=Caenorhabditis auriculariae TaxID=2777116 RepID=A0A8S1HIN5_9PELO|nr:unnamed protein product [Caenorhabditis auriculariae]